MEISPGRSGLHEAAYVMINCGGGHELSVAEELKTIAGITEIKCTTGNYDIVAKVEAVAVEILRDIITFKIRRIKEVRSTTTLMFIDSPVPLIAQ